MKNRIILATSALQIIHSMAAIKYLKNSEENIFNTYVIIIHPSLNENAKKTIEHYSSMFKFKLIDLSNVFDEEKKQNYNHQKNFIKFFLFKCKNINKNYIFNNIIRPKKIVLISNLLKNKFTCIDEIFLRTNYKMLDLSFYEALSPIKKSFLIEDGYYDFIKVNYLTRILNFDRIKQFFFHTSYMYLMFILALLKTLNLKKSRIQNLKYKINYVYKFNTFDNKNSINIGSFSKKIIYDYSALKNKENNNLAIIIGTVFWDWEMNNDDEIEIYNKLIKKIKKLFSLKNNQIYYKPHPRCKNIENKKNKLRCKVLKNDKKILVEEYISRYNVCSVFSFGSTSLVYCRTLFNVPSYFIDINSFQSSNMSFNYSNLRSDEFLIFKKYDIKKIEIK